MTKHSALEVSKLVLDGIVDILINRHPCEEGLENSKGVIRSLLVEGGDDFDIFSKAVANIPKVVMEEDLTIDRPIKECVENALHKLLPIAMLY